jgi:hypothetical protein
VSRFFCAKNRGITGGVSTEKYGAIALLLSSRQLKKNEVWMISLTRQAGKLSTKSFAGIEKW